MFNLFLLVALIMAAVPASTPSTGRDATIPDAKLLSLSPDGARLLGIRDDDTLCTWTAAGDDEVCADPLPEVAIIDLRSIAWSPDATSIAFSINFAQLARDSDLYVVDVAGGTITNLTSEPNQGDEQAPTLFSLEAGSFAVDVFPAWSPDGSTLAFSRTGGDQLTRLWTIPAAGGDAKPWSDATFDSPFAIAPGMVWLEDETLIYGTWPTNVGSDIAGLFRHERGQDPRKLTDRIPAPIITSVSPDRTQLTVESLYAAATMDAKPEDTWFIVDVNHGSRPEPVTSLVTDGAFDDAHIISTPVFAPVGSDHAGSVLVITADDASRLHILTCAGGTCGDMAVSGNTDGFQGGALRIDWSSDDTVLIVTNQAAWLLRLA